MTPELIERLGSEMEARRLSPFFKKREIGNEETMENCFGSQINLISPQLHLLKPYTLPRGFTLHRILLVDNHSQRNMILLSQKFGIKKTEYSCVGRKRIKYGESLGQALCFHVFFLSLICTTL